MLTQHLLGELDYCHAGLSNMAMPIVITTPTTAENQAQCQRDGMTGLLGTTPDVIESVAKKYREHDMPGGWILPNDGYGCGYTKLPEVVAGLAKYGFKTGLWTENGVDKIAWEVGTAGTRAQKLDVAWTGQGYQFAMNANAAAAAGIWQNSPARPFIWTVMGWAGIQRYAVTWTGDQSGSWDLHPLAYPHIDWLWLIWTGLCHRRCRRHFWRQSRDFHPGFAVEIIHARFNGHVRVV